MGLLEAGVKNEYGYPSTSMAAYRSTLAMTLAVAPVHGSLPDT